MKKLLTGLLSLALMLTVTSVVKADKPSEVDSNGVETAWSKSSCTNIQSGTLTDVNGNPITMGFDQYGYNYQAHMFNGTYDSVDRNLADNQAGPYLGDASDPPMATYDDKLIMKWSDSWLANVDCNNDFKLDRGLLDDGTLPSGISKGWLTNHAEGDYDSDGDETQDAHYSYFVKIVWVGPGGSLWGQYEIAEQVLNDPAGGMHGLQYKIVAPGFGLNDGWTVFP